MPAGQNAYNKMMSDLSPLQRKQGDMTMLKLGNLSTTAAAAANSGIMAN